MNSIGFKIKKLREHKNLSQEDLAFRLDITQSNLSKIENGQNVKIDFLLMQKVCEIFDVKPEYFLEEKLVQENKDNKNSAISIFGNSTVHNAVPDKLFESLLQNQKQISDLISKQNLLFEQLLKK